MGTLTITRQATALIVQLYGELTLQTAPDFRKDIESAVNDNQTEYLVLDLSKVSFIDSSGIGMLVALKTQMTNRSISVFLLNPSEQARTTLQLVQLTSFFHILTGEDAMLTILPE
ncbi:STAS domain-containing protein [Desulfovibrio psychrotolerans]|uniref:Anti-sigma factor antagonist n=1 Tax=Desulfovibrio psychrotolerans TaxID=415242 RepID=A0A7J0BNV7_9BACT|nr:STAS domain-containing protein [Desulfovibrio psychrotolerans]GFM35383.1 anti-sigma factor antagonist [Desulfovibrio psychrotolerans]